jgi:hypothetical protein
MFVRVRVGYVRGVGTEGCEKDVNMLREVVEKSGGDGW